MEPAIEPARSNAASLGGAPGAMLALGRAEALRTSLSMLAMVWFEAQRSGIWFGVVAELAAEGDSAARGSK